MKVFLKFILAFVVLGISTIVNAQTGKDDYSLEELVDAALQNHQLLKIKKLQVAEQETKLREANIRYYPVVNLNSGYQYNFNIGLLTVPAGSFGILPLYYPTGVVNLHSLIKTENLSWVSIMPIMLEWWYISLFRNCLK